MSELLSDFLLEKQSTSLHELKIEINKIIKFLYGTDIDIISHLTESSGSDSVCGRQFLDNELIYTCRQCAFDSTCVLCEKCFKNSNHVNHNVEVFRSGGGCCDCGDVEAWKEEGFCTHHGPNSKHREDAHIDPVLVRILKSLLKVLVKYMHESVILLSQSFNFRDLNDVNCFYRGLGDLSYMNPSLLNRVILYNDDHHTYDEVSAICEKFCTTTMRSDAHGFASIIDKEGSSVLFEYKCELSEGKESISEKAKLEELISTLSRMGLNFSVFSPSLAQKHNNTLIITEWLKLFAASSIGAEMVAEVLLESNSSRLPDIAPSALRRHAPRSPIIAQGKLLHSGESSTTIGSDLPSDPSSQSLPAEELQAIVRDLEMEPQYRVPIMSAIPITGRVFGTRGFGGMGLPPGLLFGTEAAVVGGLGEVNFTEILANVRRLAQNALNLDDNDDGANSQANAENPNTNGPVNPRDARGARARDFTPMPHTGPRVTLQTATRTGWLGDRQLGLPTGGLDINMTVPVDLNADGAALREILQQMTTTRMFPTTIFGTNDDEEDDDDDNDDDDDDDVEEEEGVGEEVDDDDDDIGEDEYEEEDAALETDRESDEGHDDEWMDFQEVFDFGTQGENLTHEEVAHDSESDIDNGDDNAISVPLTNTYVGDIDVNDEGLASSEIPRSSPAGVAVPVPMQTSTESEEDNGTMDPSADGNYRSYAHSVEENSLNGPTSDESSHSEELHVFLNAVRAQTDSVRKLLHERRDALHYFITGSATTRSEGVGNEVVSLRLDSVRSLDLALAQDSLAKYISNVSLDSTPSSTSRAYQSRDSSVPTELKSIKNEGSRESNVFRGIPFRNLVRRVAVPTASPGNAKSDAYTATSSSTLEPFSFDPSADNKIAKFFEDPEIDPAAYNILRTFSENSPTSPSPSFSSNAAGGGNTAGSTGENTDGAKIIGTSRNKRNNVPRSSKSRMKNKKLRHRRALFMAYLRQRVLSFAHSGQEPTRVSPILTDVLKYLTMMDKRLNSSFQNLLLSLFRAHNRNFKNSAGTAYALALPEALALTAAGAATADNSVISLHPQFLGTPRILHSLFTMSEAHFFRAIGGFRGRSAQESSALDRVFTEKAQLEKKQRDAIKASFSSVDFGMSDLTESERKADSKKSEPDMKDLRSNESEMKRGEVDLLDLSGKGREHFLFKKLWNCSVNGTESPANIHRFFDLYGVNPFQNRDCDPALFPPLIYARTFPASFAESLYLGFLGQSVREGSLLALPQYNTQNPALFKKYLFQLPQVLRAVGGVNGSLNATLRSRAAILPLLSTLGLMDHILPAARVTGAHVEVGRDPDRELLAANGLSRHLQTYWARFVMQTRVRGLLFPPTKLQKLAQLAQTESSRLLRLTLSDKDVKVDELLDSRPDSLAVKTFHSRLTALVPAEEKTNALFTVSDTATPIPLSIYPSLIAETAAPALQLLFTQNREFPLDPASFTRPEQAHSMLSGPIPAKKEIISLYMEFLRTLASNPSSLSQDDSQILSSIAAALRTQTDLQSSEEYSYMMADMLDPSSQGLRSFESAHFRLTKPLLLARIQELKRAQKKKSKLSSLRQFFQSHKKANKSSGDKEISKKLEENEFELLTWFMTHLQLDADRLPILHAGTSPLEAAVAQTYLVFHPLFFVSSNSTASAHSVFSARFRELDGLEEAAALALRVQDVLDGASSHRFGSNLSDLLQEWAQLKWSKNEWLGQDSLPSDSLFSNALAVKLRSLGNGSSASSLRESVLKSIPILRLVGLDALKFSVLRQCVAPRRLLTLGPHVRTLQPVESNASVSFFSETSRALAVLYSALSLASAVTVGIPGPKKDLATVRDALIKAYLLPFSADGTESTSSTLSGAPGNGRMLDASMSKDGSEVWEKEEEEEKGFNDESDEEEEVINTFHGFRILNSTSSINRHRRDSIDEAIAASTASCIGSNGLFEDTTDSFGASISDLSRFPPRKHHTVLPEVCSDFLNGFFASKSKEIPDSGTFQFQDYYGLSELQFLESAVIVKEIPSDSNSAAHEQDNQIVYYRISLDVPLLVASVRPSLSSAGIGALVESPPAANALRSVLNDDFDYLDIRLVSGVKKNSQEALNAGKNSNFSRNILGSFTRLVTPPQAFSSLPLPPLQVLLAEPIPFEMHLPSLEPVPVSEGARTDFLTMDLSHIYASRSVSAALMLESLRTCALYAQTGEGLWVRNDDLHTSARALILDSSGRTLYLDAQAVALASRALTPTQLFASILHEFGAAPFLLEYASLSPAQRQEGGERGAIGPADRLRMLGAALDFVSFLVASAPACAPNGACAPQGALFFAAEGPLAMALRALGPDCSADAEMKAEAEAAKCVAAMRNSLYLRFAHSSGKLAALRAALSAPHSSTEPSLAIITEKDLELLNNDVSSEVASSEEASPLMSLSQWDVQRSASKRFRSASMDSGTHHRLGSSAFSKSEVTDLGVDVHNPAHSADSAHSELFSFSEMTEGPQPREPLARTYRRGLAAVGLVPAPPQLQHQQEQQQARDTLLERLVLILSSGPLRFAEIFAAVSADSVSALDHEDGRDGEGDEEGEDDEGEGAEAQELLDLVDDNVEVFAVDHSMEVDDGKASVASHEDGKASVSSGHAVRNRNAFVSFACAAEPPLDPRMRPISRSLLRSMLLDVADFVAPTLSSPGKFILKSRFLASHINFTHFSFVAPDLLSTAIEGWVQARKDVDRAIGAVASAGELVREVHSGNSSRIHILHLLQSYPAPENGDPRANEQQLQKRLEELKEFVTDDGILDIKYCRPMLSLRLVDPAIVSVRRLLHAPMAVISLRLLLQEALAPGAANPQKKVFSAVQFATLAALAWPEHADTREGLFSGLEGDSAADSVGVLALPAVRERVSRLLASGVPLGGESWTSFAARNGFNTADAFALALVDPQPLLPFGASLLSHVETGSDTAESSNVLDALLGGSSVKGLFTSLYAPSTDLPTNSGESKSELPTSTQETAQESVISHLVAVWQSALPRPIREAAGFVLHAFCQRHALLRLDIEPRVRRVRESRTHALAEQERAKAAQEAKEKKLRAQARARAQMGSQRSKFLAKSTSQIAGATAANGLISLDGMVVGQTADLGAGAGSGTEPEDAEFLTSEAHGAGASAASESRVTQALEAVVEETRRVYNLLDSELLGFRELAVEKDPLSDSHHSADLESVSVYSDAGVNLRTATMCPLCNDATDLSNMVYLGCVVNSNTISQASATHRLRQLHNELVLRARGHPQVTAIMKHLLPLKTAMFLSSLRFENSSVMLNGENEPQWPLLESLVDLDMFEALSQRRKDRYLRMARKHMDLADLLATVNAHALVNAEGASLELATPLPWDAFMRSSSPLLRSKYCFDSSTKERDAEDPSLEVSDEEMGVESESDVELDEESQGILVQSSLVSRALPIVRRSFLSPSIAGAAEATTDGRSALILRATSDSGISVRFCGHAVHVSCLRQAHPSSVSAFPSAPGPAQHRLQRPPTELDMAGATPELAVEDLDITPTTFEDIHMTKQNLRNFACPVCRAPCDLPVPARASSWPLLRAASNGLSASHVTEGLIRLSASFLNEEVGLLGYSQEDRQQKGQTSPTCGLPNKILITPSISTPPNLTNTVSDSQLNIGVRTRIAYDSRDLRFLTAAGLHIAPSMNPTDSSSMETSPWDGLSSLLSSEEVARLLSPMQVEALLRYPIYREALLSRVQGFIPSVKGGISHEWLQLFLSSLYKLLLLKAFLRAEKVPSSSSTDSAEPNLRLRLSSDVDFQALYSSELFQSLLGVMDSILVPSLPARVAADLGKSDTDTLDTRPLLQLFVAGILSLKQITSSYAARTDSVTSPNLAFQNTYKLELWKLRRSVLSSNTMSSPSIYTNSSADSVDYPISVDVSKDIYDSSFTGLTEETSSVKSPTSGIMGMLAASLLPTFSTPSNSDSADLKGLEKYRVKSTDIRTKASSLVTEQFPPLPTRLSMCCTSSSTDSMAVDSPDSESTSNAADISDIPFPRALELIEAVSLQLARVAQEALKEQGNTPSMLEISGYLRQMMFRGQSSLEFLGTIPKRNRGSRDLQMRVAPLESALSLFSTVAYSLRSVSADNRALSEEYHKPFYLTTSSSSGSTTASSSIPASAQCKKHEESLCEGSNNLESSIFCGKRVALSAPAAAALLGLLRHADPLLSPSLLPEVALATAPPEKIVHRAVDFAGNRKIDPCPSIDLEKTLPADLLTRSKGDFTDFLDALADSPSVHTPLQLALLVESRGSSPFVLSSNNLSAIPSDNSVLDVLAESPFVRLNQLPQQAHRAFAFPNAVSEAGLRLQHFNESCIKQLVSRDSLLNIGTLRANRLALPNYISSRNTSISEPQGAATGGYYSSGIGTHLLERIYSILLSKRVSESEDPLRFSTFPLGKTLAGLIPHDFLHDRGPVNEKDFPEAASLHLLRDRARGTQVGLPDYYRFAAFYLGDVPKYSWLFSASPERSAVAATAPATSSVEKESSPVPEVEESPDRKTGVFQTLRNFFSSFQTPRSPPNGANGVNAASFENEASADAIGSDVMDVEYPPTPTPQQTSSETSSFSAQQKHRDTLPLLPVDASSHTSPSFAPIDSAVCSPSVGAASELNNLKLIDESILQPPLRSFGSSTFDGIYPEKFGTFSEGSLLSSTQVSVAAGTGMEPLVHHPIRRFLGGIYSRGAVCSLMNTVQIPSVPNAASILPVLSSKSKEAGEPSLRVVIPQRFDASASGAAAIFPGLLAPAYDHLSTPVRLKLSPNDGKGNGTIVKEAFVVEHDLPLFARQGTVATALAPEVGPAPRGHAIQWPFGPSETSRLDRNIYNPDNPVLLSTSLIECNPNRLLLLHAAVAPSPLQLLHAACTLAVLSSAQASLFLLSNISLKQLSAVRSVLDVEMSDNTRSRKLYECLSSATTLCDAAEAVGTILAPYVDFACFFFDTMFPEVETEESSRSGSQTDSLKKPTEESDNSASNPVPSAANSASTVEKSEEVATDMNVIGSTITEATTSPKKATCMRESVYSRALRVFISNLPEKLASLSAVVDPVQESDENGVSLADATLFQYNYVIRAVVEGARRCRWAKGDSSSTSFVNFPIFSCASEFNESVPFGHFEAVSAASSVIAALFTRGIPSSSHSSSSPSVSSIECDNLQKRCWKDIHHLPTEVIDRVCAKMEVGIAGLRAHMERLRFVSSAFMRLPHELLNRHNLPVPSFYSPSSLDSPLILTPMSPEYTRRLLHFLFRHEKRPNSLKLGLVTLPRLGQALYPVVTTIRCARCDKASVHPVLCLVCGQVVCCSSKCCQTTVTVAPSALVARSQVMAIGETTMHAWECSAGHGAFADIVNSAGTYLISMGFSSTTGSLYLDEFGDVPVAFGKVATAVDPGRLAAINDLIKNNAVRKEVFYGRQGNRIFLPFVL